MNSNNIEFYQVETHYKRVSFSPYVIAVELFLKHKNLEWDTKLVSYIEIKDTISILTNGIWDKVPTLKFSNGDLIFDSLKIAEYLDDKYPSNPLINNSNELNQLIELIDKPCHRTACKLSFKELLSYMDDDSRNYFIENRMPILRIKLEDLEANREEQISIYFEYLKPLINHLKFNKFIDGKLPKIHDYLLISKIQMIKTISPQTYNDLIDNNPSEVFRNWVNNMGILFNEFLNNRKTVLKE